MSGTQQPSRSIFAPVRALFGGDAAAGILLIAAAALAMLAANSPLAATYHQVFHGTLPFTPIPKLDTLHLWINDGLMAVFFFVVGLEVKRELVAGQLATPAQRRLPMLAAAGGMAVPAAGVPHNRGRKGGAGARLGHPGRDRHRLCDGRARSAGIESAGIAAPVSPDGGDRGRYRRGPDHRLVLHRQPQNGVAGGSLGRAGRDGRLEPLPDRALVALPDSDRSLVGLRFAFGRARNGCRRCRGPAPSPCAAPTGAPLLEKLEHALVPWSAFLVVPVFGFANAGVNLAGIGTDGLLAPLPLAIATGLVVGKQAGILAAVAAADRLGFAKRPAGASWVQIWGVAVLCGIGFTMSLFIGELAFPGDRLLVDEAKIGILAGSVISAILGYTILRLAARPAPAQHVAHE
jgi:NhaA family Na+:H+ antiporter